MWARVGPICIGMQPQGQTPHDTPCPCADLKEVCNTLTGMHSRGGMCLTRTHASVAISPPALVRNAASNTSTELRVTSASTVKLLTSRAPGAASARDLQQGMVHAVSQHKLQACNGQHTVSKLLPRYLRYVGVIWYESCSPEACCRGVVGPCKLHVPCQRRGHSGSPQPNLCLPHEVRLAAGGSHRHDAALRRAGQRRRRW